MDLRHMLEFVPLTTQNTQNSLWECLNNANLQNAMLTQVACLDFWGHSIQISMADNSLPATSPIFLKIEWTFKNRRFNCHQCCHSSSRVYKSCILDNTYPHRGHLEIWKFRSTCWKKWWFVKYMMPPLCCYGNTDANQTYFLDIHSMFSKWEK